MDKNQPRTIFEQIVFGQQITNDNIVALAENLAIVNAKIDALMAAFTPAVHDSEPDASGKEIK